MIYVYLDMDTPRIIDSEEQFIDEMAFEGCQISAVPNLLGTETIMAAGTPPFSDAEVLANYRSLQMGVPLARTRH